MIAGSAQTRQAPLLPRVLPVLILVWISLVFAGISYVAGWLSVGLILFLVAIGLAMVRPWFGIATALLIVFLFEPFQSDPFMLPGWFLQQDISSWGGVRYINFSPLEILVLCTAVGVLARATVEHTWPSLGELRWPIIAFLSLILLSTAYGILRHGGDFRIALWEIRALFLGGLIALLIPYLVTSRAQLDRLANLLIAATALLSLDVIWRRLTILQGSGFLDLSYQHETPFLMNVVVILLLARLIWPARGQSRLPALLIPLILLAEAITERRAGWIGLDIGLAVLGLLCMKIRPKLFLYVVLPLGLLYVAYLGAFWNSGSNNTLIQPARAVHSIFTPDPRDASSDLYRTIETANIRLNIQTNKLTGVGFGQPFIWYIPPSYFTDFAFVNYITHNAFLWVWMTMGPIGFITFLVLISAGVVRGMQLLKSAANDHAGPVLVACTAGLVMAVIFSYVDISLTNPRLASLIGFCLGGVAAWSRCRPQPSPRAESE